MSRMRGQPGAQCGAAEGVPGEAEGMTNTHRIFREELTPREELVIRKRVLEGQTLMQVGEFFTVTRERIRQVENKALSKLRSLPTEVFSELPVEIRVAVKRLSEHELLIYRSARSARDKLLFAEAERFLNSKKV